MPDAAKSLGVDPNCIRGWISKFGSEPGLAPSGEDAMAAELRKLRKDKGLLHHSDRGVQYTGEDYLYLLQSREKRMSMSGKGDCWGNAAMESFWAWANVA